MAKFIIDTFIAPDFEWIRIFLTFFVCIYDSAVICAWLDALAGGGKIIPLESEARYDTWALEALADGIADASILPIYENRMREESELSENWIAHQRGKVERALAALKARRPRRAAADSDRRAGLRARRSRPALLRRLGAGRPRLVAWLDPFAATVPAFAATRA